MATHSSVLAWRIPGTGEPGGLSSVVLHSQTRLKQLSSSSSNPTWRVRVAYYIICRLNPLGNFVIKLFGLTAGF